MNAATLIGTLMKKIHGHENAWVSPANHESARRTARRDRRPDSERLAALLALGECRADDRERSRRDERGSETLQRARADQPGRARREAVQKRRDGEDDDAGEEEPLAAEQVARTTAEEQEAAEDERVRVHDPLRLASFSPRS